MARPLDLMGQRFGRLVVIDQAPSRGGGRRWVCQCDCGNKTIVDAHHLRSGNTQGCGCLQRTASERHIKDLKGQRFGRLVVLDRAPHTPPQRVQWHCRCDCGQFVVITGNVLQKGGAKSCGCLQQEQQESWGQRLTTHGGTWSTEYRIWRSIKTRCLNPRSRAYSYYGGRGITICPQWRDDFAQFYADMGPRPSPRHTIERIENDGPYSPENCVWATRAEQARNKRSVYHILRDGREITLTEASRQAGLKPGIVFGRLQLGWLLIDALYAPPGTRRIRENQ